MKNGTFDKEIDWKKSQPRGSRIHNIQGVKVPYVVFDNHRDLTTHRRDIG